MQAMLDMCRQMGKVVGDPSNTLLHCTTRRKRALQLQVVVRLHVQTSNEDAILFYQRFGFAIVKQVEDYYGVRAEVRSAHLMEVTLPPATITA
jgi:ribosomal protein S18 acetylase RimI-like enzyme